MPEINICNHVGRDAVVNMESVTVPLRVRWLDDKNRQARNIRVLKSTIDHDIGALIASQCGLENVAQALIHGDPEINLESVGSFLSSTSRVFVDQTGNMVHRIQQFEIIKDTGGNEVERRPRNLLPQNVSSDTPLSWTGTFLKKSKVVRKFVFANKMQLMHINGLTYDFFSGWRKTSKSVKV